MGGLDVLLSEYYLFFASMTRALIFLSCFLTLLFSVPSQGGCSEIFGNDTEIVTDCRVEAACRIAVPPVAEKQSEWFPIGRPVSHGSVSKVRMKKTVPATPARILNCVLRE